MADHSRLWVYTSERPLRAEEIHQASHTLTGFCQQWAAHGHPMRASWAIFHQQFLVLAADEEATGASGCSIDSSTRMIRQLGVDLQTDFFNRSIPFLIGENVQLVALGDLKGKFSDGSLDANSMVLPVQAATRGEWMAGPSPVAATWLSRYLGGAHDRNKKSEPTQTEPQPES